MAAGIEENKVCEFIILQAGIYYTTFKISTDFKQYKNNTLKIIKISNMAQNV